MSTQDTRAEMNDPARLVRTSVLIPEDTDRKLRELCKGKRPLSWEIREALEQHVERNGAKAA